MEVSVQKATGFPEGSILSIRAGQLRRQGPIACPKAMSFGTTIMDANPFKVDVYAPLASKRVTLVPKTESYSLCFEGDGGMQLDLCVKEAASTNGASSDGVVESRQARRQKAAVETQDYIEQHKLVQFVQNLMQSVLAEKPADPFAYIEQNMRAARATNINSVPAALLSPSATTTRAKSKPLIAQGPVFQVTPGKTFKEPAYVVMDAGTVQSYTPLKQHDIMHPKSELRRLRVPHLSDKFDSSSVPSPLSHMTASFVDRGSWALQALHKNTEVRAYYQTLLAGPRKLLHFNPKEITAAIVTCGGLCPGLNSVIREIVMMLHLYGVDRIYGIVGGFKGVMTPENWLELSPDTVADIHIRGGTVLVSDRGNPPHSEMAKVLKDHGVRQYFVIGGDGTLTGAMQTYDAMCELNWECAVVGVPKTIDNDIAVIDKTFGFDTACTEAKKAIDSAYVEATCNANCIGLVKLMGRHAGFITMNACMAARNVDICLLPEMDISLEKVLQHTLELMQTQGHAVIVVAEGCGDTLIKSSGDTDAGGNKKLADIGPWLKDQITAKFKEVKLPLSIKYIDPTYMIRAVPPNCYDRVYCSVLAQNSVHAAMAGYTGVTVGRLQTRYVFLPIHALVKSKPKRVDVNGRWFQRLVAATQQPSFIPHAKTIPSGDEAHIWPDPMLALSDPAALSEIAPEAVEIRCCRPDHLSSIYGSKMVHSTLATTSILTACPWVHPESWTTQTSSSIDKDAVKLQMLRAGPRENIYFQPDDVAAAIVTCGTFAPGVNSVIRELVIMLFTYGVRKVYGIKGGFNGVLATHAWVTLRPDSVQDLHMLGGSVLVSDVGNPTPEDMAQALQLKGVKQFFCIGGHGTHKGAYFTNQSLQELKHECSVVCIPQSVENDIQLLDRTFGFDTACTEAEKAIDTAYVEATGMGNCIGLVKLMGRQAGFIAMHACLAARHVDMCLLPEMDINLEKVLEHAVHLVQTHGYAVVVVAEGCGDMLLDSPVPDVGLFLKEALINHFSGLQLPCNVHYIDPTYMIRAVPANANDSIYCSILAHAAVHGAMAGYTGMTVAQVDERYVYLPSKVFIDAGYRRVDMQGSWLERLMATTQQPNLSMEGQTTASPLNPQKMQRLASKRRLSALGMETDEVRTPNTQLTMLNGFGEVVATRPLRRGDLLQDRDAVRSLPCFHLSQRFGRHKIPSTLIKKDARKAFMDDVSFSTQAMHVSNDLQRKGSAYYQMTRAGPREMLHFDPCDPAACALLVSCGGICPGLNSVIREVVNTLWQYGVRKIYGVRGGYKGVMEPENWLRFTPDLVKDVHMKGGTMLISDRGNPLHMDMAKVLRDRNVKQYFVLGGDGTHMGAMQTFDCLLEIGHECAVVGVPKTIDNDVPMMDQTFGFDTACTEALKAVQSAHVEAISNANCIGLVKLMGRHCGHITLNAAIAASFVDICLLPEMDIDLQKVLTYTTEVMRRKGHCVIVVAEGCGDTIVSATGETDAGGNRKLADVGAYLKSEITLHFKKEGLPLTIKFIDPTYMIRSVPANAYDSVYCSVLAQNAVHGAMAGFSGITIGKFCSRYVYLPIHAITKQKGNRVDIKGRHFMNLINSTQQPDFTPNGAERPRSAESSPIDVLDFLSQPASINSVLRVGDEVKRLDIVNLGGIFTSAMVPNPVRTTGFVGVGSWTTQTLQQFNKRQDGGHTYLQMVTAGPREHLHFDPAASSACIVNCGGLCPGLNAVIRELVMMLSAYGVNTIWGCKGGYKGLITPEKWVRLTPETVGDIHQLGGSVLVSDRGNPPHSEIAKSLKSMGIKQYFVIGGDGTHKGGMQTFDAMQELQDGPYECAVVGVPKTIDNDIAMLDNSFGFNTAVTEAERAIDAAYVEACCVEHCIGIVKLMGRSCGFIAMEASLAARHVDICLLPEMNISLPKLLKHCLHLVQTKKHVVLVVAEGCGDTLIKSSGATDAGGNKILADVGLWLKQELLFFFQKMQQPLEIKYIDPTYMIRAVPSNANDTVFCTVLAQFAVHGAMAGYSGITVGKVDEKFVMLPIHAITKGTRQVNIKGRQFERLMHTTMQPDLSPGPGDDWALLPPAPAPAGTHTPAADDSVTDLEIMQNLGETASRPPTSEMLEEEVAVPNTKLKVFNGYGEVLVERPLQRSDLLQSHDEVRSLEVMCLSEKYPSKQVLSPLKGLTNNFQDDESWAVQAFSLLDRVDSVKGTPYYKMVRAGPREYLHFDPKDSAACAAIITSGDLCPGLNCVIRELVLQLKIYGVPRVFGVPMGFNGIPKRSTWIELTAENVEEIHMDGGCMLGSAHGHDSARQTARSLADVGVRQLFVIGGDGSQKGAIDTLAVLAGMNYECSIIHIPKTIDNDLPIMDKTFGFDTAVCEARRAIDAAYVEATCNANCIGLVKLLGKESGFVSLNAVLASRVVDLCLLPEMAVDMDKVLAYCEELMSTKGYGVIVVSQGCGMLFQGERVPGPEDDVGVWLKDEILARFKQKSKTLTIKYIDPTYMIRAVPANASDSVYCSVLAQHAVNGAMAGFTGVTVAKVYERIVYLPTLALARQQRKSVNTKGRWFSRLLFSTKQPDLTPDGELSPVTPQIKDKEALKSSSRPVSINMALDPGDEVHRLEVINLACKWPSRNIETPLRRSVLDGELFLNNNAWTTQTFQKWGASDTSGRKVLQMLRSGPREILHWDPSDLSNAAAIVTCGGICPGLNSVIREVVKMLNAYGVKKIYGIIGGFKGCVAPETWIELTEKGVQDIHNEGGSVLVSDRGNPPHIEIAKSLANKNIRQYFVLGGDGTNKGAMQTFDAMQEIDHECSVIGIPKTIDNDIALLDTSFGFDTASTEAAKAIISAYVESTTNANCIGLVKLMGRHCGFIAALATIAARVVDVCLIPEMSISKEKLLDYVAEVMRRKQHAVIVVAEGCGDTIISSDSGQTDAGGNKVLADVGPYLKEEITTHCKKLNIPLSVKYIDPTYMIRSVPANAYDSLYCATLAQQAVHGAMAGYSGVTVGKVDERYVMLPIHAITKGTRSVDVKGRIYERLIATTKQPSFAP
eukprot:CAMPEP_0115576416 /NCGR_PEP_ID=MMETSP0272-20121206/2544_1 /TAXON_ID=71861 /ORGANISM="Scrippsiella trochoidea, Strain CCMP3099" /LENGTH=3038 /DNA_ID=CAMNT_0003011193 /DNA_START=42 /DNA_END=9158 /DNA_ORIENTATION=-